MSGFLNNCKFGGGSSSIDTGDIGHSIRCRPDNFNYLERLFTTPTSTQKGLIFLWVRRSKLTTYTTPQTLFCSSNDRLWYDFGAADQLSAYISGADLYAANTKFRDPNEWTPIILSIDTTQSTASNRVQLYAPKIAGATPLTLTGTQPTQNASLELFSAVNHRIANSVSGGYYFSGYLARLGYVDGHCIQDGTLSVNSFMYLNTDINTWVTKTAAQINAAVVAAGGWGNNGDLWDFDNGSSVSALGYGKYNSKNWNAFGFSLTAGVTYDWMADVPGNSYATLNYLDAKTYGTTTSYPTDGNLKITQSAGYNLFTKSTLPLTFETVWEATVVSVYGTNTRVGITKDNMVSWDGNTLGYTSSGWAYVCNGNKMNANSASAFGATFTTGDVIGCVFDPVAGTLKFYKNGVLQGTAYSGLTSGPYYIAGPANGDTLAYNFGQQGLQYAGSYGTAKALCQANLTMPSASVLNPKKHADVVTWTGDGTTPKKLTSSLQFALDFLWGKCRSNAVDNSIYDRVRGFGVGKNLITDTTDPEGGTSGNGTQDSAHGYISSVQSDGFTATAGSSTNAYWNYNLRTFMALALKAGGDPVTNNAGSITSQVSANPDLGFSIVTWNGNSIQGATVGHGLPKAVELAIVKARSGGTENWYVWHKGLGGGTYWISLNLTNAQTNDSTRFAAAPSSTVLNLGNNSGVNATGYTYVAYCFHSTDILKVFSYTGNASADGTYIDLGFKPRWAMLKRTDAANWWVTWDSARNPYNGVANYLQAESSNSENNNGASPAVFVDSCSSALKLRDSALAWNASGGAYIGIAIADVLGKYS